MQMVGVTEGLHVGFKEGTNVGLSVTFKLHTGEGATVSGCLLGQNVGEGGVIVDESVGFAEGDDVSAIVGTAVGRVEGLDVGRIVGLKDGEKVG